MFKRQRRRKPMRASFPKIPGDRFSAINGETITVAASTTEFKTCNWSYVGRTVQGPVGLNTYNMIQTIAQQIVNQNLFGGFNNTTALNSMKFEMWNQRQELQLMNMANSDATITAFKIRARNDLPDVASTNDPIATYGQGLAAAGFNTDEVGITNEGILDDNFTLFDSPYFLQLWEIVTTKKFLLKPGRTKTLYLSSKRKHNVNIMRYKRWTDESQSITGATRVLAQAKGATFWVIKAAGTLGRASATATPGFTTPEIVMAATTTCSFSPFGKQNRVLVAITTGIGSGAVSVREPYDMDYKTNTIAT